MHYTKLGHSGLNVSRVCLGSMTWGRQNTQQDADEQLNYALAQGVNFIDTAEVYRSDAAKLREKAAGKMMGDAERRMERKERDGEIWRDRERESDGERQMEQERERWGEKESLAFLLCHTLCNCPGGV